MTLQELETQLSRCQSLAECDQFLQANLHQIRPLFYGLTRRELQEYRRFDYEDVFDAFASSKAGCDIRDGHIPPASVVSLLIFFLSVFERALLYRAVHAVTQLIPAGPLRQQSEALFEYKNIENSAKDYLNRFDTILTLLQQAWNHNTELGQRLSENLLQEYLLDAILEPKSAGLDIRSAITARFLDQKLQQSYPILLTPSVQKLLDAPTSQLEQARNAVRSHIMEDIHTQACLLVPDVLLMKIADEFGGETEIPEQTHNRLPDFLDDQLERMNAAYSPQYRSISRTFSDADEQKNCMYLGTYFPRTVIESWNIFTELLSIPVIQAAFRQKDIIRLLDIGSGTGGAVAGALLALNEWGQCEATVAVTALDANQIALTKHGEILDYLRDHLTFELDFQLRYNQLPSDLEGFIPAFSTFLDEEGHHYDLVTCWKSLCEFYNTGFAPAQGIIRNLLNLALPALVPNGLCVVADVTSTNNNVEHFAITLNREVNEYEAGSDAKGHTILPLCCASRTKTCDPRCYTQRLFRVGHQLASHDQTKIAYRVLTPDPFWHSITASFNNHEAYRVNAAKIHQACANGSKRTITDPTPCGYTGFFTKGE
ncbi:MAG: hypothetical protein QG599_2034 [Pseudomonadota bacterium]|nr:hypothetical protein [Pseudomonadota bacterium]